MQAKPDRMAPLYVVDMYCFLIEHLRWIPAERLAQIDACRSRQGGASTGLFPPASRFWPLRNLTQLNRRGVGGRIGHAEWHDRD
ncbi:MAG: hypothetical protein KIT22_06040 [Verrucomicrobiae bacterium]|nr:hypothetical protein [Verrucomicrobiae bacterium]